jgi:hypothetical protein
VPRVTLVVGQAQQGKTTLALTILRSESRRGLILDPVRSKPFNDVELQVASWDGLVTFLTSPEAEREWVVVLRSSEFGDYVAALRAAPYYRHTTLLVDEGMTFAADPAALVPLVKISRMNAHFGGGLGVPMLITAQRPMDLPRDVRSQADRWYSFKQEEPGDLQYLAERCSPAFADAVAGLERCNRSDHGPACAAQHQWLTYPPGIRSRDGQGAEGVAAPHSPRVAEEPSDAQGRSGGGVRPGSAGRPGGAPDDPAAQFHPEAPRSHEVVVSDGDHGRS